MNTFYLKGIFILPHSSNSVQYLTALTCQQQYYCQNKQKNLSACMANTMNVCMCFFVRVCLYVIHNCIQCVDFSRARTFYVASGAKGQERGEKKDEERERENEPVQASKTKMGTFLFHLKHSDTHSNTHTFTRNIHPSYRQTSNL